MTEPRLREASFAARRYYLDGASMDEIAADLNTSRSTVSRLVAAARREGLVEIRVHDDHSDASYLERELERKYGVHALVTPVAERASAVERLEDVAEQAARFLSATLGPNMTVGIAWGSTISAVSRHLVPKPTTGMKFVQLNGAGNIITSGIGYASEILSRFARNFTAQAQQFPVPTLFDNPATKRGMWEERSTRRVLDMQRDMDATIFSIGSPFAEVPSQVYSGSYLDADDLAQLAANKVVGDVATIFFREDGSFSGIPLNSRSSGPEFNVLRHTRRRICIAADPSKTPGVRGALAAGLITDLIVDDLLAQSLMQEPSEGG